MPFSGAAAPARNLRCDAMVCIVVDVPALPSLTKGLNWLWLACASARATHLDRSKVFIIEATTRDRYLFVDVTSITVGVGCAIGRVDAFVAVRAGKTQRAFVTIGAGKTRSAFIAVRAGKTHIGALVAVRADKTHIGTLGAPR